MMIRLAAIACMFFILSCTGLKKSQVEATEKYALATRGISRVPSDIYFRISQLRSESQTLQLSTLLATNNQSKESIALIKSDYNERMQFINIAEEYSAAYMIVEQYATLVLCLINEKYLKDFSKSKDAWQVSFDKMIKRYNTASVTKIPASVGKFTASVIEQIGKMRIAQLQKRYLAEAIHTARVPFENICDDFIQLDSLKIRSELKNLSPYLDNNYANFLENVRAYEQQGSNPYQYYNEYIPIYTGWLTQLGELAILSDETVHAFRKLRDTYAILQTYIDGNNGKVVPAGINELMTEYGVLADDYRRFEYRRQKLDAASLVK